MQPVSEAVFLERLLKAERPGSEAILAFYDSTADALCTSGHCLFIPLIDHLCHRGDALFESICVCDRRIYSLEGHLDRLRKGAAFMQLEPPCSWEKLRELVCDVVRAGNEPNCGVKIFLGRGAGGFGVSPFECPRPSLYIVAVRQAPVAAREYEEGLSAFSSKIPPKQSYLATIKNTNYLPNVLMAREAADCGMDVAVTFHEDGTMGEAAVANIGIVSEADELLCPPLDRILAGTSMLCAMSLAEKHMPVRFTDISREDLAKAKEVLLFSSSRLCVAISHFDGKPVGNGKPGPVAHWLLDEMRKEMERTGVLV